MDLNLRHRWLPRIEESEAGPTAVATAYFFLLMATYYVLKPVRSSLFLHEFSADELPYVYLLVLAAITAAAWVYDRLVRTFRLGTLVPMATLFFVSHILIFWVLLAMGLQATPETARTAGAPGASPGSGAAVVQAAQNASVRPVPVAGAPSPAPHVAGGSTTGAPAAETATGGGRKLEESTGAVRSGDIGASTHGAPGLTLPTIRSVSSAVTLVYFVWVSIFNLFVVMMFWSLTNRCFDAEQGSRLYGLVGGGGVLGALVGSIATNQLSHTLHTENLLLVSACLLLPTTTLARWLYASGLSPSSEIDGTSGGRMPGGKGPESSDTQVMPGTGDLRRDGSPVSGGGNDSAGGVADDARAPRGGEPRRSALSGWALVAGDPYVRAIGLVIFLYTLVGTIFDYQFSAIVKAAIPRKDDVTAYFGGFFLALNVTALIIQIFLTGPVQKRHGPMPGLTSLPCIAIVGSGLILGWPVLAVATAVGIIGQAITYSIHQASKELLYLPTAESVKVRAKAVIDTFVFRAGDAVASLLILFWNQHRMGPPQRMFLVVGPASVLWLLIALSLCGRWREKVQGAAGPAAAVGP